MDYEDLKWDVLTETNGRPQAEMLKSHLNAEGIEVELVQEAIGHLIYPVMIDGLGRVQVFVRRDQLEDARRVLAAYSL
jgi:hypothetical protein